MDEDQIRTIVAEGEGLGREFKSELHRLQTDDDIVSDIVAMANTEGGVLLLGVEDDGTITGTPDRKGADIDPVKIKATIYTKTVPNINTRVTKQILDDAQVLAIEVEPYPEICSTSQGKALHRIIDTKGKPQSVPFYPRDHISRRIHIQTLDLTNELVDTLSFDAFDPIAFAWIRRIIQARKGDQILLELSDEELAKALTLVETKEGVLVPNYSGLLLLGKEEIIRKNLPHHEIYFQVIDGSGNVRVNDVFHGPLAIVLQEIEDRFSARNTEREVTVGLFRVPIPDYSAEGFREAMMNAILHRDYSKQGSVFIQWQADHLLITNPGGFPEGVTLDNLLVHEPKPRNPKLAEIFRRIGLVETTGRGVDKIFMGQITYGRPAPDYSRTDADSVRVVLPGGESSLEFAALIFEQDRNGKSLTLDELLILNALHSERRITTHEAGFLTQKGTNAAKSTLERLVERGLIQGVGEKGGRHYMLSSQVYKRLNESSEYVRAKGYDPIQLEQMVISWFKVHPRITRSDVMKLCFLSKNQATRLLLSMTEKYSEMQREGVGKGTYYSWKDL
ncbi:putative DNA binding domain-containing protein [Methanospirillum purgamenti]|uniref:DNA binding domain-containing protein n=1 Tax=Methanospirillum hungatei TaxID=2203 RepID=A0A8F5VMP6_METHU|nr:RNA-binding domain-containing protein [Methanospirillum hungatei]QXO93738.1 putative DNA binding domain-containing protein [Methanospirillum hungatei]